MSFAKPCIAPLIGCIPEVLDEKGAFLYDVDRADGLETALGAAAARRSELAGMGAVNRKVMEGWAWSSVAAATKCLYAKCLGR